MATGRVRFSPEMLTNWTEAGGEASIDTHDTCSVIPYGPCCLCRSLQELESFRFPFR